MNAHIGPPGQSWTDSCEGAGNIQGCVRVGRFRVGLQEMVMPDNPCETFATSRKPEDDG